MRRCRCIRPGGVDTRACPRHTSNWRPDRACRDGAADRQRSRATRSDGRTPRANPLRGGARTAPGCAKRCSDGANRAERKSACCWPAGASVRTAADSSSRSTDRAPRTSGRPPRRKAAPPTARPSSPHTRASRRSSAAPPGNGALASRLDSVAPRCAEPAAPRSL